MSLKSKIEAVIYASEEPVTLAQLVVLLSEEAQSELDAFAARQSQLPLSDPGEASPGDPATEQDVAAEDVSGSRRSEASPTEPAAIKVSEQSDYELNPAVPQNSQGTAPDANPTGASGEMQSETNDEPDSTASVPNIANASPATGKTGADIAISSEAEKRQARERERAIRDYLREIVDALVREYADADRGLEIREVAGGFRFGTKPEYHDAVRGFVKSLKPALKLSLQALETLAVVAYKQPVTAAEISEIRGVDSAGVLGGLLTRKLIQTAGRKQVIGRPMLYKTTKEFLVRFGLRDIQELPSMDEFERMAGELAEQEDLPMEATSNIIERANARGDAEHIRETSEAGQEDASASPAEEAGQPPASVEEDGRADAPDPESSPEPESGYVSANVAQKGDSDAESSPKSEVEPTAEQEPA